MKEMTMHLTHVYVPLVKMVKNADGTMLVSGPITSSALDRDSQICNADWLDTAVPEWFGEGGNVREMHQPIAAGKAVKCWKEDGKHWAEALVVDPGSVVKVENNVLTGFSIGIKNARVIKSDMAPNGEICDGKIIEVSLVDRPANPECMLQVAKSDDAGVIAPVAEQVLVEGPAVAEVATPEAAPEVIEAPAAVEAPVELEAAVEEPVEVPAELPARPVAPPAAAAPLMAASADVRAQARSVMDALSSLGLVKTDTVAKADDESKDIKGAHDAIAAIARLIQSEAQGLEAGELDEAYDIDCLLAAVEALRWFIEQEQWESASKTDTPTTPAAPVDNPPAAAIMSAKADAPEQGVPAETLTVSLEKVQELIDAALTKVATAHEEETASLRAELAKVKAEPMPGGPVRVPTLAHKALAADHDTRLIIKAARDFDERANATTDRDLADGYRRLAAQERAKLTPAP